MRTNSTLVALAFALMGLQARAKDLFVAPNVRFEGKTEGQAEARATLGLRIGVPNPENELIFRVNARVATKDGLATLLGFDKDKLSLGNDWKLGLSGTYAKLPLSDYDKAAHDEAVIKAVETCSARCTVPVSEDKTFCEVRSKFAENEELAWVRSLVLRDDLPRNISTDSGDVTPRLSYRVDHLWNPSAAGVARWMPVDGFCAGQQPTAKEIYAALKPRIDDLRNPPTDPEPAIRAAEAALSKALAVCLAPCKPDSLAGPQDRNYCKNIVFQLPREAQTKLGPALCPAGKRQLEEATKNTVLAEHPTTLVNFGIVAGQSYTSYFSSDAGTLKLKKSVARPVVNVGVSATHLIGFTSKTVSFEGRFGWALDWDAASSKVRACAPTEQVEHGDPAHVDPGESCDEGVLGAPTRAAAFSGAAYVGILDTHESVYRASIGLEAKVPTSDPAGFQLAIALPTYFVFTGKEKDSYKGLIRINPTVTFANKASEADPATRSLSATVGVSLTLLGERLLFSEEFDKL